MNRMLIVFFISLVLAVLVSPLRPSVASANRITMEGVTFRTSAGFNVAAVAVVAILVALYAIFW